MTSTNRFQWTFESNEACVFNGRVHTEIFQPSQRREETSIQQRSISLLPIRNPARGSWLSFSFFISLFIRRSEALRLLIPKVIHSIPLMSLSKTKQTISIRQQMMKEKLLHHHHHQRENGWRNYWEIKWKERRCQKIPISRVNTESTSRRRMCYIAFFVCQDDRLDARAICRHSLVFPSFQFSISSSESDKRRVFNGWFVSSDMYLPSSPLVLCNFSPLARHTERERETMKMIFLLLNRFERSVLRGWCRCCRQKLILRTDVIELFILHANDHGDRCAR